MSDTIQRMSDIPAGRATIDQEGSPLLDGIFMTVLPVASPTVHTTGFNWDAIVGIVSPVVIILGAVLKYLFASNQRKYQEVFQGVIEKVIATQVTPQFTALSKRFDELESVVVVHGEQIAELRGIEKGQQRAIQAQANARQAANPEN